MAQPSSSEADVAEVVELDYLSDGECPSKASFLAEVSARIRRPVTWVVTGGNVRVALALTQQPGAATGRLDVSRGAAPATRREFTAATCGEVGSALALVVALALDPNARTEELPAPPAVAEEPTPPTPAPDLETRAEPPPAPPPPSAPPRPVTVRVASPRSSPHYSAWLGPVAGVDVGYAPVPLVMLGFSFGARVSLGTWLSPMIQLTPSWGETGGTGPSAELGAFAWTLTRLEVCPLALPLTRSLTFSPCLAGEVGRLSAQGRSEQVQATFAERWWVAPGLTGALHLERGSWFARLGAEAIFPAIRDEFVLRNPERLVHQASVFAYGARLGVGFRLGE